LLPVLGVLFDFYFCSVFLFLVSFPCSAGGYYGRLCENFGSVSSSSARADSPIDESVIRIVITFDVPRSNVQNLASLFTQIISRFTNVTNLPSSRFVVVGTFSATNGKLVVAIDLLGDAGGHAADTEYNAIVADLTSSPTLGGYAVVEVQEVCDDGSTHEDCTVNDFLRFVDTSAFIGLMIVVVLVVAFVVLFFVVKKCYNKSKVAPSSSSNSSSLPLSNVAPHHENV
jgi:hypothetical protein